MAAADVSPYGRSVHKQSEHLPYVPDIHLRWWRHGRARRDERQEQMSKYDEGVGRACYCRCFGSDRTPGVAPRGVLGVGRCRRL
jgi:hypothetical protein